MSNSNSPTSELTHLRIIIGGVHEANRQYTLNRLQENIDGFISSAFLDDNNLVEIIYDVNKIDQFQLLSHIQRLGHPVQMFNSEIVQAQLRIDGMHCNSCVSNICGTVLDLPGVIDIHLTFLDKLATISYDPSIIQLKYIISEIESLKFKVAISNEPILSNAVQLKPTETNKSKIIDNE